jgi:hypothetical protein
MHPEGFETTIPASTRPPTVVLNRSATEIGRLQAYTAFSVIAGLVLKEFTVVILSKLEYRLFSPRNIYFKIFKLIKNKI